MVRLIAPITSFLSDEVWRHLPKVADRPESVHLALFPAYLDIIGSVADPASLATFSSEWQKLFAIREEVLKALEHARQEKLIGTSLEAQVRLAVPKPTFEVLSRYEGQLRSLFIVSSVVLASEDGGNGSATRSRRSR